MFEDSKAQSELAKDIIKNTDQQIDIKNEVLSKANEISANTNETSQFAHQSGIIAKQLATVSDELRQQLQKS